MEVFLECGGLAQGVRFLLLRLFHARDGGRTRSGSSMVMCRSDIFLFFSKVVGLNNYEAK